MQDAKAKLSEVLDTAKRDGPQIITRRGVEEVAVVPIEQWNKMNGAAKPTLSEILRSGPKFDLNIPPRGRMRMRKPIEFWMFLLDTNVISELRKLRPRGAVLAWAELHAADGSIRPSIVVYELQAGVEATRKRDGAKAAEIELWIDEIVERAKVLPLDASSARLTARLMQGRQFELIEDAMIAAIAMTNRLTVATRNVRDFKRFGVATVNPFADSG